MKAHFPFRAQFIERNLNHYGGRLSVNRNEAKEQAEQLAKMQDSIEFLHRELSKMSSDIRDQINVVSTPPEDRNERITDSVTNTRDALADIWPGVNEASEHLIHEAKGVGRGRIRNEAVYEIARIVAEIFVRGTVSETPAFGNRADGLGEAGPYVKAVRDAAQALGHERSTFRGPCEEAIAQLTEERMASLRETEFEKFRRGWRPSLLTGE